MFRLLMLGAMLFAGMVSAQAPDNSTCEGCHEEGKKLVGTAHEKAACAGCHVKHEEYPHPKNVKKAECASCHQELANKFAASIHGREIAKGNGAAPDCAMCHGSGHEVAKTRTPEFVKSGVETCGMCHSEALKDYSASVHGKLLADGKIVGVPVCSTCHSSHEIRPKSEAQSTVSARNVRETCGQCHGNVALMRRFGLPEDRLTTFDASFHGLASRGGSQTVANCASCHGFHRILPSSDPASMTHVNNLPQTCGQCHPGAGQRFAIGPMHVKAGGPGEHASVKWARWFYLTVIPATIGFMLLHNLGDWIRKLISLQGGARFYRLSVKEGEIRMYPFEQATHAVLAVSFIVLAWSGFALKYPGSWWAGPLNDAEVRRNVHRIAAVAMVIASVMHVASLVASRKLRHHWTEFIPKARDVRDAMHYMMYALGLRNSRPELPPHSYIEKAEYWAVVWGTVIMVITGAMLWFNTLSLRFLPSWALDLATTVHWFEAVLATLAIIVWHFYSVIFDPEVYPMDTAWLTGRSVKHKAEEAHQSGD